MILPSLFIAPTSEMGRGVFTSIDISKDTVLEVSPVIVMTGEERRLLDQTLLHDYIFEWGNHREACCMALGYVPLYNHSYKSNCEYEMDFDQQLITIRSVRFIKAGETLMPMIQSQYNWVLSPTPFSPIK